MRPLARIIGLILLIAAPSFAAASWHSTRGPRARFAAAAHHRTPGDSLAYSSAAYHAARADATLAARWSLGGFGTLGVAGFALGLVLTTYGVGKGTRAREATPRADTASGG